MIASNLFLKFDRREDGMMPDVQHKQTGAENTK